MTLAVNDYGIEGEGRWVMDVYDSNVKSIENG